ncbi:MAG: hypothetical protein FJX53_09200, partial [Alphaproteobacteria bacterium]|nr:hypothetical protein [Alphaproteobacteria bacterium]
MPRSALHAAPLILAAVLAGCFGNGPVLGHADLAGAYEPNVLWVMGTGGNELRTVVHGNPFPGSAESTRARTIQAMQGSVAFAPVRFAAQPTREHPSNYRVIMVFQPAVRQSAG